MLGSIDHETITLEPVERPMRIADSGGKFRRDEIEKYVYPVLDTWR